MKRISYYIICLALLATELPAQPVIRSIIPENAVTVGEPFRIQFVVEKAQASQYFNTPDFGNLKIIKGPEVYNGRQIINGEKTEIANYIFTLIAEKEGDYRISNVSVKHNGIIYRDKETEIKVVKKEKLQIQDITDEVSGYSLLPGEDVYRKIQENLSVRLFVDKRTCFIGEPIVATFKLFSRLQSKSDIVKNPGFYGFSVHDMINLDDKVRETERIKRKEFDVHTIRKVQLYPLQAGLFTIDEMKIENKVEFSRSVVGKKTEQKISEGNLGKEDEAFAEGAEVYEMDLSTEPVTIKVNPLPAANKPPDFNGAAGNFTIRAALAKNQLDKNQEGFLEIIIEGKGNFTQITAPVIQWPKELEGFEPSVKDFLDKRQVPLSGGRIFRYPFLSAQTGQWKIPPVRFSFFNTNKRTYQVISSDSINISISDKEFKKTRPLNPAVAYQKISIDEANRRASRTAFTLVALAFICIFVYWFFSGKKKKEEIVEEKPVFVSPSADVIFDSLQNEEGYADKNFYSAIHTASWKYLSQLYSLAGTELNKNILAFKMKQSGNDDTVIDEILNLLNHFETARYTQIGLDENRAELAEKMKSGLAQLKR